MKGAQKGIHSHAAAVRQRGKGNTFSANGGGQPGVHMHKISLEPVLEFILKLNETWLTDLNIKSRSIRCLEKNTGENL